jgi:serine/threonine-protein kinase
MVAQGAVYAGNDSSTLFAIDLTTGEKRWTAGTPGPVRSMPTVVNGVVYVTDATGHVTAFAA